MKRHKLNNPILGRDRQKIHAIRRFRQRYKIFLSDEEYFQICNAIQGRKRNGIEISWIVRESRTRCLCKIIFHGIPAVIIYSGKTKRVVTALPKSWLKKNYSQILNYQPKVPTWNPEPI